MPSSRRAAPQRSRERRSIEPLAWDALAGDTDGAVVPRGNGGDAGMAAGRFAADVTGYAGAAS
jgi:hypothetical protein